MTSSVDPTTEIDNIETRLKALTGETYIGVPQGTELPVNGIGQKAAYRDFEPGSVIPAAQGRLLAGNEQQQPHVWSFQVHHWGPTRRAANALAIETDTSLLGWEPSENAGPISTFYFNMYDETAENGQVIGYIATRFYNVVLGMSPDMSLTI